jgi:vancomycin permeability regulator SanA
MGSPEVPTAPLDQGRSTGVARSSAGDAKRQSFDDDDENSIPMKRIASIAAALVVLYLLVTFVDVVIASRSDFEGEATAAVVLGAAQYNGEPSPALAGRLDHAGSLYLDDRVELVVVTGGGQADDITTEAKTGYDYLRETASIPDEDLRLEVDGDSTYSSLAATARFLTQEGVTEVVLVTDPYHARRSKLIAEEVGLTASVSPTDASSSIPRLVRETGAVAIGRLVGFRRFDAYIDI